MNGIIIPSKMEVVTDSEGGAVKVLFLFNNQDVNGDIPKSVFTD